MSHHTTTAVCTFHKRDSQRDPTRGTRVHTSHGSSYGRRHRCYTVILVRICVETMFYCTSLLYSDGLWSSQRSDLSTNVASSGLPRAEHAYMHRTSRVMAGGIGATGRYWSGSVCRPSSHYDLACEFFFIFSLSPASTVRCRGTWNPTGCRDSILDIF